MKKSNITTIKLTKETKDRLNKLRIYKRETYEEILERLINVLNILHVSPERARSALISFEHRKQRPRNYKQQRVLSPTVTPIQRNRQMPQRIFQQSQNQQLNKSRPKI
ncbi:MAG: hypothetical protein Q7S74_02715 [Nanoarchaeota archaeon]|nr:hypothetical protein [Nanoarchaeota archaeon]